MSIRNNKSTFCIDIAEHTIEIVSLHTGTYVLCEDYLSVNIADISIHINKATIELEGEKFKNQPLPNEGYLESIAIYRMICESLLSFSTFLMHGAVIAIDKQNSFLFTAKSGTGKTTHICKWLENTPEAFVVNGDKPLIKVTDTGAIAYGTPWCGKEHLNTNIGVPLRSIVLMERSEDNVIEEISFSKAFPTLLQQTYRPADADKMRKTLSLLSALNGKMKFYRFRFNNMKPDTFRVSYEALTGQKI